jgi:hypothetical protein
MGTASFHVGRYGRNKGEGAATLMGTTVRVSGAFSTSTSAANLEDSTSTDVVLGVGEVLEIHADEPMRIRFGGEAATASVGVFVPENVQRGFECTESGTVSIIDVS